MRTIWVRGGIDYQYPGVKIMEKRMMERYDIPLKTLLSFTDSPTRDLTTTNISAGGVFFETDAILPVGAEVYLSIFPGSFKNWLADQQKIIRLQGRVLRRNEYGVAICFYEHHF